MKISLACVCILRKKKSFSSADHTAMRSIGAFTLLLLLIAASLIFFVIKGAKLKETTHVQRCDNRANWCLHVYYPCKHRAHENPCECLLALRACLYQNQCQRRETGDTEYVAREWSLNDCHTRARRFALVKQNFRGK